MRHHVHILRALFVALALCFGLTGIAAAQEITGSIVGTVKDANGAAVKGATVTITNSDTKLVVRTVNTNDDGEFSAALLPVAYYDVAVEATGFKKHVDERVKLNVDERRTVNIDLAPGNISETVTVTSEALQVDTQTATASNVINGTQIVELSLNNRNWAQLITLSPGVTSNVADQIYVGTTNASGQSNQMNFSVNGVRQSSNTYTVDGADTTDRGANLTVQTYPSVDAIREFVLLRGLYPAESGRSSGGQVNVITKSGSSKFHGDVYEFWRNEKLNANSFFTNRNKPLGVDANGRAIRAPLRYHDFGATFSGPLVFPRFGEGGPSVIKGKTFFFFSEEVRRVIIYPTLTSTVPSAAMRQGIFSQPVCIGPVANPCGTTLAAGTALPASLTSPLAASYVQDIYNKLPLPSDATGNLLFPTRGVFNFRQELIRLDHQFNNNVSAYYRFENDSIPTIEPGGIFNGTSVAPFVATTQTNSPGRTHVGHVTWVQSATTVLDIGASYSFGDVPSVVTGLLNYTNSPDIVARTPAFPFAVTRGRVPTITGNGFSTLGTFGPYSDFSYNKAMFATLSKVFGAHTTKYGFNFSKIAKHENSLGGTNEGTYGAVSSAPTRPSGTSATNQLWANFLLGNFQTFTQNQFDITADLRASSIEAFAQDEWRFRPNITVSYGMRFSRYGQPWDGNGRLTNFDPKQFNLSQAFQILAHPLFGDDGTRIAGTGLPLNGIIVNSQAPVAGAAVSPFGKAIARTPNNFAPRFGIAWDPFKKGTTSVRIGYGIYFDQVSFNPWETIISTNPPFQARAVNNPATLDNPLAGNPVVSLAVQDVYGIDTNFKTPYVQHWSLDLQHQFGGKTLVSVGYFGSKGTHLTGLVDLNLLPPGYALTRTCVTNTATAATAPCQAAGLVFTSNSARTTAALVAAGTSEILLNEIRPFRGFGAVRYLETAFDSNYHSLQIKAQRRFARSSQFNLAYTWSRNMTDSQNEFSTAPQDTYHLNNEYSRAIFDRRHVLSANYIYELPYHQNQTGAVGKLLGGWQISGITYYYTGLGFSPATSSNDPSGIGLLGSSPSGARPDINCDPNAGAPNLVTQWFNTACFANPPAGVNRVGNSGRNTILGPSTTRFDATLSKRIRFGESRSLQLRWEVFNIFNHTNFTTFTSTNVTSGSYGQVNNTRDPRTMQLGAKFIF
jgi:Carboxypeptidase regulatory-like domain/TonB-dependent Receptor Plug Domain